MTQSSSSTVLRYNIHTLTSSSPISEIRSILDLSNRIFNANPNNPTHHSLLEKWQSNLMLPGAHIFYVTRSSTPDEPVVPAGCATPHQDPDPLPAVGFCFCYKKVQPEIGIEGLHIWLAGVEPHERGNGILGLLASRSKTIARVMRMKIMSICTVPGRFGRMFEVLKRNGWEVVAGREGGVVLFKLEL